MAITKRGPDKKPRKKRTDITEAKEALKAVAAAAAIKAKGRNSRGKKTRPMPKDVPEAWTPEFVQSVAEDMWAYIEATPLPTLAEFCYTRGIYTQRIYEHKELAQLRTMLHAKRAAALDVHGMKLTKMHGARGAFILRAMANVGDFSFREKAEIESEAGVDRLAERKDMYAKLFGVDGAVDETTDGESNGAV